MSTDHGDWAEANAAPKDLYDPAHEASRKGWGLLKSIAVQGDGIQAPGAVTMCKISGHHPYVVHFFNAQDGGFHEGCYCLGLAAAEVAYAKRIVRFQHSIEPWDTDGDTSRWNENGESSERDNDRMSRDEQYDDYESSFGG